MKPKCPRPVGRPAFGQAALTPAERQRKRYWKKKYGVTISPSERGRDSAWLKKNASRIAKKRYQKIASTLAKRGSRKTTQHFIFI